MRRSRPVPAIHALALASGLAWGALPAAAAAPDYAAWGQLLAKHYDPAKGMDYKGLKAQDAAALAQVRKQMAAVDPASLSTDDRLAYWINLYNVSVVATVVEHYPVDSIRDISTDPIVRLNVFKKETVPVKGGKTSLDKIENEKIRAAYKDPRIHFAINCAAATCPPIRPEPYVGAKVSEQLDDQARKFLTGKYGVRIERDGGTATVHTTKIMDWFGDDFETWGGGKTAFLKRYLPAEKAKALEGARKVEYEYDAYDWKLNDWKR